MTNYTDIYNPNKTPQTEPIPNTTQVQNSAGGYSWAVNNWTRLDRFLILGSESSSYYASAKTLTEENATAVIECINEDGVRVVKRIVEISEAGRAPKNDPAIFALALACTFGDKDTKKAACNVLHEVCRIGTHLFTFAANIDSLRGWGRSIRRAVGDWYNFKSPDQVAYQVTKYAQRNGWSHKDVLRLAHVKPASEEYNAIFKWITKDISATTVSLAEGVPQLVTDFAHLKVAANSEIAAWLIQKNPKLTWEMVPTELLNSHEVWEALLPNIPMTAMIRNLARLTANGFLGHGPGDQRVNLIVDKLTNVDNLKQAKIHPLSLLVALKTYAQGKGERGKLEWIPITKIIDALNDAFYMSFGFVEPSGKRYNLALDVSGSMDWSNIAGMPGITPRVGSAAMALITAATERDSVITAFSHGMVPIDISPRQRLDDVLKTTDRITMGGTDCSLPMLWALQNKIEIDTFVIYTDNETWAGKIHPVQALREYRNKMGINAKLVVVGMLSNGFTIADPNDSGMLDVVGFDTATPQLISGF